jgi:hypothetical protein
MRGMRSSANAWPSRRERGDVGAVGEAPRRRQFERAQLSGEPMLRAAGA